MTFMASKGYRRWYRTPAKRMTSKRPNVSGVRSSRFIWRIWTRDCIAGIRSSTAPAERSLSIPTTSAAPSLSTSKQ